MLNFGLPWLTFGRLRTAHTNLVLFGFGVSALIGTSFYSVQRTSHVRLFAPRLAWFVFYAWQVDDRARRLVDSRRLERRQGVCGARMAVRHRDRRHLGRLTGSCSSARSRGARSRPIYISNWFYGALIIVDRDAAHREQPRDARDARQVLLAVPGRAGRDRAVVVRPQRRRFPADRRIPRHALLLPAEAGRAADLELPAVDRRVLGVRLQLHLGRPASPALQRDSGVAAVARRRHEPHPARAFLGDDDQRRHDGQQRVAEAADGSRD